MQLRRETAGLEGSEQRVGAGRGHSDASLLQDLQNETPERPPQHAHNRLIQMTSLRTSLGEQLRIEVLIQSI